MRNHPTGVTYNQGGIADIGCHTGGSTGHGFSEYIRKSLASTGQYVQIQGVHNIGHITPLTKQDHFFIETVFLKPGDEFHVGCIQSQSYKRATEGCTI